MGAPIPQCTAEGLYETKQCHGSTGYCVCVNEYTGEEYNDTKAFGTEFRHDCKTSPPSMHELYFKLCYVL